MKSLFSHHPPRPSNLCIWTKALAARNRKQQQKRIRIRECGTITPTLLQCAVREITCFTTELYMEVPMRSKTLRQDLAHKETTFVDIHKTRHRRSSHHF
jgi:hypothetical protein